MIPLPLFDPPGEIVRNPLCMREPHCGGQAVLGSIRRVHEDCENQTISCLRCSVKGEWSTNLTLGKAAKKGTR